MKGNMLIKAMPVVFIFLIQIGFATTIGFYPIAGVDTSNFTSYILTSSDINKLIVSDDSYYQSKQRWYQHNFNDSLYIEMQFSPNVPQGVIIKSAKLYFEWHQSDCHNILGARLKIWNGTWQIIDLNTTNTSMDKMEIIDLINILNTPEKVNSFKLQFQAHDYGGGGYSFHDLVKLEVEYYNCGELNETDCNLYSDKCEWCPECSGRQVNQWHEGRCINKGSGCGYHCELGYCNAECEVNCNCSNYCSGEIRYFNGACTQDCVCIYSSENCNDYDGWYNTSEKRWVDIDQCKEKEQRKEEYRDYSCSPSGCIFNITETRWIDTSNTRNKPDGTACDDGLYCTVNDACTSGTCGGVARD
ncbi:MAG: hypothetical protein QXQ40_02180, partial [Candidatus Aenigmatarchaeota archaeon]